MFSERINHMRLQQAIIVSLGVLLVAVLFTSCAHSKSCSAYQEIESLE